MKIPSPIRIAHSPDADDAFMFYALSHDRIDTKGLVFEHCLRDIQTLNEWAIEGKSEVTALSFHTYAYVHERYELLPSGASMGEETYGPVLVGYEKVPLSELKHYPIAVPGNLTTAFLLLKLLEPEIDYVVMPFNQILPAVQSRKVPLGLLIHEGQLTYQEAGLTEIINFGRWWHEETGLPLPLGGNAIRKSLPAVVKETIARLLRQSIEYGLAHREEALDYAMRFAHEIAAEKADRFVDMYVNQRALAYGQEERQALQTLFDRAYQRGVFPQRITPQFVDV